MKKKLFLAWVGIVVSYFSFAGITNAEPTLDDVLKHFDTHGIKLEGVARISNNLFESDGFDTVEMIRAVFDDKNTHSSIYDFTLYRHRNLEKANSRLELGKMMNWPMYAKGAIVLQWKSGTKKEIIAIFKSFGLEEGKQNLPAKK